MGQRNDPTPQSSVKVSPTDKHSRSKTADQATTAVLIPVKSFSLAKGRLADRLEPQQRAALAKAMAKRVVESARPLPTFVICDNDDVAAWATEVGAAVIWSPVTGLNQAVTYGRDATRSNYKRVIIAHADLPLANDLAWVADFDGITIVQDRRGDGTNVMSVPTVVDFQFQYGEQSAARHRVEADRLQIPTLVVDDDKLGLDVDTGQDFDLLLPETIDTLLAGLTADADPSALNDNPENDPKND